MKKIGWVVMIALVSFSCQNEKTGFVDTEELLLEYNELKEAKERFTKMNDDILADMELRIKAYQIKEDLFRKNGPSMSRKKQEEQYNELTAEAQQLQQERQVKLGQLQAESQGAIDSLITKVKDRVKNYGEANGFTYIYGNNDAGSVLYGKPELDLTKLILSDLNESYEAAKK